MPKFSSKSISKLHTCHKDLQVLFSYIIKHWDCSVIFGHRTPDEQFELYKKGRHMVGGEFVIKDKSQVVTYKDGFKYLSKHNLMPSMAVDVAPYPSLYQHADTALMFAGYVLGVAQMLKDYGAIDSTIICGHDWDNDRDLTDQTFYDTLHFEILT
jgi:peptidoglycan L-alanyl-D-glutamate endopeptidase CwlK